VHKPIPAELIEVLFFLGGDVRCAEYATPGTAQVGLNAVPALQERGGCLLNNHGVVAVGEDIPQAHLRAEYIEDAAKIAFFAAQLGTPFLLGQL
jgi:ribulose-5-phosphate 4-epimerase/fuculose-1-phosphate aldolase